MSSNICKVKCGNKETEIKIQRPSFKSVEKGYTEISKFDIDAYNARQQVLYDELYNLAQNRGQDNSEAHKFAELESLWIVSIEFAEPRYKQIGGKVETLFNSDRRKYVNTCALRVSYALNYSTHPINTMNKQIAGRNYQGADTHTYYLGVFDIIKLLKTNWKEISWNKSTYAQVKKYIKCGYSKDFYHTMTSKDKNQRFFKELQSLNRKGVVSMIGTGGLRHTTLWNGNDFLDTALGISVNYLDDTTDLIRELYFWDLI
ncbi:T6SS effector amidase Tae4 family protein [Helicobacter cinaedi]|uniref:T6SS effector amidase Tae4 family protein n=2 Tax=Helicobacter cinaedi TaxID=213 RepID=UPI000DC6EB5A|nr:T6SS effector amidase Tae4 family protein [Helicobacter cinaedi]BBB20409.1 hypothetical protein HC081234_15860 [Helicobacter cinaedi]